MKDSSKKTIVDSNMGREAILAQNPESIAPQDVIDNIEILVVEYLGFDDVIHSGQIAMSKSVSNEVKEFFELALKIRFPIEKVIPISNEKYKWDDVVSCDDNNSSGFNYRKVLGTNRMSKHSSGSAFDINPVQNIYVRYDKDLNETARYPKDGVYNENAKGTLTKNSPLVILMKNLGWDWGGDWTPESGRVDYQHFEKNILIS